MMNNYNEQLLALHCSLELSHKLETRYHYTSLWKVSTGALASMGFWGIDVLVMTQRGRPVAMLKIRSYTYRMVVCVVKISVIT
jgi:hypothetical protein